MDPNQMRDEAKRLPALRQRLQAVQGSLHQAEAEVAELLRRCEKEQLDVENMEKESFSNFLLRTLGRYEAHAEKQRQEAMEAKARYDKARAHQRELELEMARLRAQVKQAQQAADGYQAHLEEARRRLEANPAGPAAKRLAALEEARRHILAQQVEVTEAAHAAERAAGTAQGVLASLGSAEEWATWDVWGGKGIITHMAKYENLDAAEAGFNTLAAQLHRLQDELADVEGFTAPQFSAVPGGQRAVDYWFDNIFTDLSVRDRIRENQDQVEQLQYALGQVRAALAARAGELARSLDENARQQEDALLADR